MFYPIEDTQLSVSLNKEQRTCNFNVHVSSRAEDDDEKTEWRTERNVWLKKNKEHTWKISKAL